MPSLVQPPDLSQDAPKDPGEFIPFPEPTFYLVDPASGEALLMTFQSASGVRDLPARLKKKGFYIGLTYPGSDGVEPLETGLPRYQEAAARHRRQYEEALAAYRTGTQQQALREQRQVAQRERLIGAASAFRTVARPRSQRGGVLSREGAPVLGTAEDLRRRGVLGG